MAILVNRLVDARGSDRGARSMARVGTGRQWAGVCQARRGLAWGTNHLNCAWTESVRETRSEGERCRWLQSGQLDAPRVWRSMNFHSSAVGIDQAKSGTDRAGDRDLDPAPVPEPHHDSPRRRTHSPNSDEAHLVVTPPRLRQHQNTTMGFQST